MLIYVNYTNILLHQLYISTDAYYFSFFTFYKEQVYKSITQSR